MPILDIPSGSPSLLVDNLVVVSTHTLIYGFFVLLYTQAAVTYGRRNQRSRAQFWMFLISTASFLLATIYEAIMFASHYLRIQLIFSETGGLSLATTERTLQVLPVALMWIENIQIIMNDAVVAWRAVVLVQDRRWKLMIILLTSFSLLAIAASSTVYTMRSTYFYKIQPTPVKDAVLGNLAAARYGTSLGINIIATVIIGCMYWTHRKDMAIGLGKHSPTQVERVLALLMESGIAFCILQALNFMLGFVPSATAVPGRYFFGIIWSAYIGLSSIYPTAVVALVNRNLTLDTVLSMNASLGIGTGVGNNVATLQFALTSNATSQTTIPEGNRGVDEAGQGREITKEK